MHRTLNATLIFALAAVLPLTKCEVTLSRNDFLLDVLFIFGGGFNNIHRHVQRGKDISFFRRAEEKLPGYLRVISAAWDAAIVANGHATALSEFTQKMHVIANSVALHSVSFKRNK